MKQKMRKLAHRLWTDESGQGTAEYALIVVVIVVLVMLFRTKITEIIGNFMDTNVKGAVMDMTHQ